MKKTHRPLTLAALLCTLFMAATEMTVVSTAMPTVVGNLGGIELYAWVFTAYMLAATVTVPLWGKLSDLYGRKPVLQVGIVVFIVGSALSGLSPSMTALIGFRALQGLGAGAMQPVALTVVGDIYDLEERSKIQGLLAGVWGLAGLVGPLLGGAIVRLLSWHWVFYLNVPFGLASLGLLALAFHEEPRKVAHRLDLAGAGLLTAAVLLLLASAHGGKGLLFLPVAGLLLWAFVRVERRTPEPVLPLQMMRRPVIAVSSVAGALVGAAMVATATFVPLYVQAVLGGQATDAGAAIAPMVIGWPIASTLSGRLVPRVGFRPLVRLGLLLSACSSLGLALFLRPDVSLRVPQIATFFFGAGLGLANTALLLAVQTSVEWKERGVATGTTMFFRTIGGTLAVGALGGLVATRLQASGVPSRIADTILGPTHGAGVSADLLARTSSALAGGLAVTFWVVFAIALAAFVASLFFPGQAAAAPAAAEAA